MESTQETLANGRSRSVATTSAPDANGRLGVTSRYTEETTTTASGRRETVGTVLVPGFNGALQESRRTESTEREVRPGVVHVESTERVRGQNGGWETAEVRSRDTRPLGPGDSLEDETIQRQDASGRLAVSQRNITRRTEANGRVMEVTETFGDNLQGLTRPDTPMGLSQRVTRTTTATAGGGSSTVEEVEGRSIAAPNERMRVVRRNRRGRPHRRPRSIRNPASGLRAGYERPHGPGLQRHEHVSAAGGNVPPEVTPL